LGCGGCGDSLDGICFNSVPGGPFGARSPITQSISTLSPSRTAPQWVSPSGSSSRALGSACSGHCDGNTNRGNTVGLAPGSSPRLLTTTLASRSTCARQGVRREL
jgi:hypothetical protein